MRRYAEATSVPIERSKAEIERILKNYGADQFMYAIKTEVAMIMFRANNRLVRFILPMPNPAANEIKKTKTGRSRKPTVMAEAYIQEVRRRWRALSLSIKGKLEAVGTGIMSFEQEFLSNIVLPDDTTVGEFILPQVQAAYESKKMPKALPFLE
jgi:hypothetical protein